MALLKLSWLSSAKPLFAGSRRKCGKTSVRVRSCHAASPSCRTSAAKIPYPEDLELQSNGPVLQLTVTRVYYNMPQFIDGRTACQLPDVVRRLSVASFNWIPHHVREDVGEDAKLPVSLRRHAGRAERRSGIQRLESREALKRVGGTGRAMMD